MANGHKPNNPSNISQTFLIRLNSLKRRQTTRNDVWMTTVITLR
jgi:hypothetical protein